MTNPYQPGGSARPALPPAAVAGTYLALYVAATLLAERLAIAPGVALWFPPAGLTAVLLLVFGTRYLPAVAIAEVGRNLLVVRDAIELTPLQVAMNSALITAAYGAGALLLRRAAPSSLALRRAADLAWLTAVMGGVPVLLGLTAGALPWVGAWSIPLSYYVEATVTWWLADALGVLSVAPCLLTVAARQGWLGAAERAQAAARSRLEVALQFAATAAVPWLAFQGLDTGQQEPASYLCFVPLTWVALRHGIGGAAPGVLLASTTTMLAARPPGTIESLLNLRAFMLTLELTVLFLGVVVTERCAAARRHRQLLRILDATPDVIAAFEPGGRLVHLNPAGRQLLGIGDGEPPEQHSLRELFTPESYQLTTTVAIPTALREGSWRGEVTLRAADGTEVPFCQRVVADPAPAGPVTWLALIGRDQTERKRAERARQQLAHRVVQAAEDERRRLAANLHDDAIQALVAALMHLDALERRLGPEAASLARVRETLDYALAACRQLLFDLRPPALDEHDLATAIDLRLRRVEELAGVAAQCDWRVRRQLDGAVETTVFRAVQEALTNVAKHAKARQVRVRALEDGATLKVEVIDDGKGFDPQQAQQLAGLGHLGLQAMRERVELVGGSVRVESACGKGTRVLILLPLGEDQGAPSAAPPPASVPAAPPGRECPRPAAGTPAT